MVIPFTGTKSNRLSETGGAESSLRPPEEVRLLIGDSPVMQEVYKWLNRIAPTDSTVVILGETGTGKELAAREIHRRSRRSSQPFVTINCGALPENLIESELFGHRKGSFTGADTNRAGLFEVADGGTLFLDEIGELPKGVQAKLLRFLESGEVRRIGENTPSHCDVRVVCATLRHLETMVQSGEFREDLWFRINTFEIHLPPLKERKEDIPQLICHFAARFRNEYADKTPEELFTPDAFQILMNCDFPGNVRQLANTVEHALVLADALPVNTHDLPPTLRLQKSVEAGVQKPGKIPESKADRPVIDKDAQDSSPALMVGPIADLMAFDVHEPGTHQMPPPVLTLQELELRAVESAVERNNGNKPKAAEELGISIKTLYNKLNQIEKAEQTA